jgi:hypothetical protein
VYNAKFGTYHFLGVYFVSQHLYTVSEIAAQMGKSERWVRQLCIKGKLNAVKHGWAWVILEAWK